MWAGLVVFEVKTTTYFSDLHKFATSSQTTRAWVCRLDEEGLGRKGAGLCGLDW